MNNFEARIQKDCHSDLYASEIRIIQVNIGLKCNMSCKHCHLNCGPSRNEMMNWETMAAVIDAATKVQPEIVDITGGSPEIHPFFKKFVEELRKNGHTVQVRTNLTALLEPGNEKIPEFLKKHRVHITAYAELSISRSSGPLPVLYRECEKSLWL